MSDFWIYESHTPGYEVRWRITDILHQETTPFQKLEVVETVELGKALILTVLYKYQNGTSYLP